MPVDRDTQAKLLFYVTGGLSERTFREIMAMDPDIVGNNQINEVRAVWTHMQNIENHGTDEEIFALIRDLHPELRRVEEAAAAAFDEISPRDIRLSPDFRVTSDGVDFHLEQPNSGRAGTNEDEE